MLNPLGERNGRRWTGSSVTAEASGEFVVVYAPCGAMRKMSPAAAREIAQKLVDAAKLVEEPKVDVLEHLNASQT